MQGLFGVNKSHQREIKAIGNRPMRQSDGFSAATQRTPEARRDPPRSRRLRALKSGSFAALSPDTRSGKKMTREVNGLPARAAGGDGEGEAV